MAEHDTHEPSNGGDVPPGDVLDLTDELEVFADPDVVDAADPEVVDALETLVGALVERVPLDDLLEHVLHLTERAITACAAVSVTVADEHEQLRTVASTDPDATAVDQLQYDLDEGPCIDAIRFADEQLCDDLTGDPRWPRFSEQASQLGFDGVLAQPLIASGTAVGALNVFVRDPGSLDEEDRTAARRLAVPAAATLANARAYRRAELLRSQLAEAARSRAVIEQAKGIVMATRGCDADEAFAVLRELSQRTNQKLRTVADALVRRAGGSRPSDG
ncbi:GAF and ANTAR domain-containing protein [Nitriliruptoraceae bacterium ZYF776]|nr:GAF and ANTAR domain-containing protein [Profundirhabdus halotolerans]